MAIQVLRVARATRILQSIPGLHAFREPSTQYGLARGGEVIKKFELAWDRLAADSSSPTQHFIWAAAFAETYGDTQRVRLLSVGPPSEPSALAALISEQSFHGRLETLGVRELYEPTDFLYAEPEAARALAELLLQEGRAVWLRRLPADSPLPAALQAAYHGRGLVFIKPTHGCPYIELDGSWSEPESRFKAGRRSDFRRALRHAEQLGKVSFEVRAPDPFDLRALLDEAWAVEAAGWKAIRGSALACNARRGEFFRRYALAACRKGILRLCFMRIDDRAVAMQFAVECAGRFWLFKIGYDERFDRCSPGNLLMLHTVAYAARRGLRSYEFLGCAAPWTAVWTRSMRDCVAVRAYPFTARGLALLSTDAAGVAWRRWRSISCSAP
jgi:CelD/BcsL family acetyltransferase involved in cellulose biosynthesis